MQYQGSKDLHGKPRFSGLGQLETTGLLEQIDFFWIIAGKSIFDYVTHCGAHLLAPPSPHIPLPHHASLRNGRADQ